MNLDAIADKLAKDWSFMERGEFFEDARAALVQVRDEVLENSADAICMLCQQFGHTQEEIDDWIAELEHKDSEGAFDDLALKVRAMKGKP